MRACVHFNRRGKKKKKTTKSSNFFCLAKQSCEFLFDLHVTQLNQDWGKIFSCEISFCRAIWESWVFFFSFSFFIVVSAERFAKSNSKQTNDFQSFSVSSSRHQIGILLNRISEYRERTFDLIDILVSSIALDRFDTHISNTAWNNGLKREGELSHVSALQGLCLSQLLLSLNTRSASRGSAYLPAVRHNWPYPFPPNKYRRDRGPPWPIFPKRSSVNLSRTVTGPGERTRTLI